MFKDDPMFDEVVAIMKAHQLRAELDPDYR